jgi:radical SAM superfamily enzyme YgiQ (UPF0313 family)
MKIGLIYPSRSRKRTYSSSYPPLQNFFDTNYYVPSFYLPSLSLLTIAACTPPEEEIKLIDERVSPIDFDEPFDIVGISILTEQARRGYEIAQRFKESGVFTVMGGIHASVLPKEARQYCDAVVIGEGEIAWPDLLKDFRKGTTKEFYTNSGPVDLDRSPIPRYDLVDVQAYPFIPLQTTRGCPLDCSFCTVTKVYGPKFRNKTTDQIIRELEAILKISINRKIVFNDDNMFLNRAKSYELLKAIKPLKIKYFSESDISIAKDERLLDLMWDSGCVTVFIGFESLVPENLDSIQRNKWKRHYLETYAEACKNIQTHGIQVLGAFILGFDYDTGNVFQNTKKFVLENNILGQFHIMTPFPGTRTRDILIKEKRLPENDGRWDIYSCFDAVYSPKLMTKEEIEAGLLDVYQTVYSREAYLKRSRHMIEIFKTLRRSEERTSPEDHFSKPTA